MRSIPKLLIAACCLAITTVPYTVRAEEAAAPAAEMPGCPGKADGAPCCTSCQDKIAQGVDPAKTEGGCPCQRARKAREAAAAKAREAAAAPAQ